MKSIVVLLCACFVFVTTQTPKPGACPNPPTSRSTYSNCRVDENCRSDLKCCTTLGRANACTEPVISRVSQPQGTPPKPGKCPPPYGRPTKSLCAIDTQCPSDLKCCGTLGRAFVCLKPIVERGRSMSPPGNTGCPIPQNHPGAWVCGNMCGHDSDCYTGTKCCENRCGAKVCTQIATTG